MSDIEFKKYVIRGLGEFFDGLVVHCEEFPEDPALILVNRIEQPSQLFETFSLPVSGGMYIHSSRLELYVEPDEEQLTDNPFGAYKAEGKIERSGVTLLWGLYSRALTLTVKNLDKTLLSQNVFDQATIDRTREFINDTVSVLDYDMYNIVFDLQEICDG